MEWHRPRYRLDGLSAETRQTGVTEEGAKWSRVPPGGLADRQPAYFATRDRQELAKLLQERLGGPVVDFADGDLAALQQAAAQLADLVAEWPEAMQLLERVEVVQADAPWLAQVTRDGKRLQFNGNYWRDGDVVNGWTAGDAKRSLVPRGCGNPAGATLEEAGHQVKTWLDSTGRGTQMDAWLDANPLPDVVSKLRGADQMDAMTRRQESFARGFMAGYRAPGGRQDAWSVAFRNELRRLAAQSRNL